MWSIHSHVYLFAIVIVFKTRCWKRRRMLFFDKAQVQTNELFWDILYCSDWYSKVKLSQFKNVWVPRRVREIILNAGLSVLKLSCLTCAKTVTRLRRQQGQSQRNPIWRGGVFCLERKHIDIEHQKWWEDKNKLWPWQIEVCGILCLVPKGSDFSEKHLFPGSLNFSEWDKAHS